MQRLFFALWPDEQTRESLFKVSQQYLESHPGRQVPRQNLHLTLSFLGNVEETVTQKLIRAAGHITAGAFSLQIDHAGWWKKPKIIWLAPATQPAPLLDLVQQVNSHVSACGLTPEDREYCPHMTILRKIARFKNGTVTFSPIHWQVESFCLVESVTHASGVVYTPLKTWSLS